MAKNTKTATAKAKTADKTKSAKSTASSAAQPRAAGLY